MISPFEEFIIKLRLNYNMFYLISKIFTVLKSRAFIYELGGTKVGLDKFVPDIITGTISCSNAFDFDFSVK